jgi:endonuclease/exonuclease/phosphatase family metal-dependent hydrolase
MLDTRYQVDNPSGPEFSFIGSDFTGRKGDIIDHIFVSEKIRVLEVQVLNNCRDQRCPSDHLPVVALIKLLSY